MDESTTTRTFTCIDCGMLGAAPGKRGTLPARCQPCKAELARRRALPSGQYTVGPNGQYDRPGGVRICRICKQSLPIGRFRLRDAKRGTYRNECYECFKSGIRARYHADPDKHRDRMRRHNYGLPLGQYKKMHDDQGGRCAVCGEREQSLHSSGRPRDLFVDHHHASGVVRGLLCMPCNMGIGQFRDDVDLLRKAIEYLNKYA